MPSTINTPLFDTVGRWLTEVNTAKTAAAVPAKNKAGEKQAGPSGLGKSTHPTEDVDDNTQDKETGERYEENSRDVKQDVPGNAVDEHTPGSGGSQDDKQYNIGTNQSAVGEDPSVEDDYKGDKDDPGTGHPADAEDTGEKYSSMTIDDLLKTASAQANSLLADFAVSTEQSKTTKEAKTVASTKKVKEPAATGGMPVAPNPIVNTQTKAAANAGYDVASQVQNDSILLEKIAADTIARTIKDADTDADLVGAYLQSYAQTRVKLAEEGEGEEPKTEEGGGGEESPPTMPADAGAGAGDVLGALGSAGESAPPVDAGAPPGGGLGGEGGGSGAMSVEQALQELGMALQESGMSPDQFLQLVQGAGGGGGAGGPPPGGDLGAGGPPPGGGMGGPPPMPPMPPAGPEGAAEGAKLASAVKQFMRSGKFKIEEAKTAAQRQVRDQIKDYIRELTGSR